MKEETSFKLFVIFFAPIAILSEIILPILTLALIFVTPFLLVGYILWAVWQIFQ